MNRRRRGIERAAAFSLVELLISLALGSLLASGTISVYMASKQQFFIDDQLARVQENGRYATRLLSRELSMSGFYGGILSSAALEPVAVGVDCNSQRWALRAKYPLDLVNNHRGAAVPTTVNTVPLTCINGAAVVEGSDVLAVKRSAAEASLFHGEPLPELTHSSVERWYLRLTGGALPSWEKHRPAALAAAAHLDPDVSFWEARATIFYLRQYAQFPGDNVPTLCLETLAGEEMTSRCFVEGVEAMQFEFGIDTDDDGVVDRHRADPDPLELSQALLVRMYLLVRSLRPLAGYSDDKTYYLGSQEITTPADGYLRRVFSTSVRLRNVQSAAHNLVAP